MRPSVLRPSILSTEGLDLLHKESLRAHLAERCADHNRAFGNQPKSFASKIAVRCLTTGKETTIFTITEAYERFDLHQLLITKCSANRQKLLAVIEYGDEG